MQRKQSPFRRNPCLNCGAPQDHLEARFRAYCKTWSGVDWSGFVKGGFVKGGFVKGGFVKHGFVKHIFVKGGL